MKNKKIIPLTIAIVAVALIGTLGLSKIFENGWQNENTVDNSLNIDIIENTETVFNYPYINKEIADNMEEKNWFIEAMLRDYFNSSIPVPENAITYQQTANIIGDAITYACGFTGHQKNPAFIMCCNYLIGQVYSEDDPVATHQAGYNYIHIDEYNGEEKAVYRYQNWNELKFNEEGSFTDTIIDAFVDVYTGEIYLLDINYNDELLNENPKFSYKLPFGCNYAEGQTEKEMLESALEITQLMGCTKEFQRYCVLEYKSRYVVFLEYEFGKVKEVNFLKEVNNCLFTRYSDVQYFESPYNFKFKNIID